MVAVHPIAYLLRRAIICALIFFYCDYPFMVTLALIAITMVMFTYVANERPWKFSLINQQHRVNEACLYICLALLSYTHKSLTHLEA